MYKRVYDFSTENKTLHEKQFGFHFTHSTEHAIFQLSDRISNSFNEKQFTLGKAICTKCDAPQGSILGPLFFCIFSIQ